MRRSGEAVTSKMPDTILRPGVVDDTMPRHGMVKSNDLPLLEVVIADSLICDNHPTASYEISESQTCRQTKTLGVTVQP
jgi:hypothetical protein